MRKPRVKSSSNTQRARAATRKAAIGRGRAIAAELRELALALDDDAAILVAADVVEAAFVLFTGTKFGPLSHRLWHMSSKIVERAGMRDAMFPIGSTAIHLAEKTGKRVDADLATILDVAIRCYSVGQFPATFRNAAAKVRDALGTRAQWATTRFLEERASRVDTLVATTTRLAAVKESSKKWPGKSYDRRSWVLRNTVARLFPSTPGAKSGDELARRIYETTFTLEDPVEIARASLHAAEMPTKEIDDHFSALRKRKNRVAARSRTKRAAGFVTPR